MLRLVGIVAVLLFLIAATGVRVVALWPQSQAVPAPPFLVDDDLAGEMSLRRNGASLPDPGATWSARPADDYESLLLRGLQLFRDGDIDQAVIEMRRLTDRAPGFELAHLILGDLLLARFAPIETIGSGATTVVDGPVSNVRLNELRSEAVARLRGYLSLFNADRVPRSLIALGDEIEYALVIDKSKNRLYVFRNVGSELPPQLVDDFYIVLGRGIGDKMLEGDLKTPTGTYFVTGYLAPEKLPPLYGSGAFPINYPNEYDRRLKKTGYGIWLHGTDRSLFSRPPLDSEGCVVLTNEEFLRIRQYVAVGRTPVIIHQELEWLSQNDWIRQQHALNAVIEEWRHRWEKTDLDAYLQMYADDFWSNQYDLARWSSHKRQIFAGKTYQQISLSDVSLYEYPRDDTEKTLVVADFVQHYRSNNFNGDMRKRLYLVQEQEQWKVLYEGGR